MKENVTLTIASLLSSVGYRRPSPQTLRWPFL